MVSSNFQQFDPNTQNILNDTNYTSNTQRQNGVTSGQAQSALHNKLFYQTTTMCTAIAQFIVNQGYNASDANLNTLVTSITSAFAPAPEPTGVGKDFWGTTLPSGYVWANGETIGNASSNATGRANTDTQNLFTALWNAYSNTLLPIYNSDGSAGTRGVSALSDYTANKALSVPDKRERISVGMGTMGGASDPGRITSASVGGTNVNTLGGTGGEEAHALSPGEGAVHNHGVTDAGHHHGESGASTDFFVLGGTNNLQGVGVGSGWGYVQLESYNTANATTGISINNAGSGTAHSNTQPYIVCNYIIKL